MPSDVVVRAYEARDRSAVRAINCATALMGQPSSIFFDDDEIFADALTLYFTDHVPGSCFVAGSDGEVIGYLICADDIGRMGKVGAAQIILPLIVKALRRGTFFRRKNLQFVWHVLLSVLKGEFKAPDIAKEYPATWHINVLDGYRAAGVGARLVGAGVDHLRSLGVKGVHLATMSDQAGSFFEKQGFKLLFQGKRSYFRYFLSRDVMVRVYGMLLSSK